MKEVFFFTLCIHVYTYICVCVCVCMSLFVVSILCVTIGKRQIRLTEKKSKGYHFMYTHACVTCMARARVTTALRYCIGSSGPSHLFCHVKGH